MITLNGTQLEFKIFPNGESFLDLDPTLIHEQNTITVKFESNSDLLHLQFIKDEIDDHGASAHLVIPYFPYCRMDRKEETRILTLRSVTKMINNMRFASVTIMEPHSDATPFGLSRACVVNKSKDLVMKLLNDITTGPGDLFQKAQDIGVVMVYPDAGAMKRYQKQIKYPYTIDCTKEREFSSGKLTNVKIHLDQAPNCKIAIIVDDLCSGGMTFGMIARELQKQVPGIEKIYLVVTHCENTVMKNGLLTLDLIDGLYTTNSLLDMEKFFEMGTNTVKGSYIEDIFEEAK